MMNNQLIMRLIACIGLLLGLSACVGFGRQANPPMYYQPALYGHQPVAAPNADFYALRRR